jgi:hypothetical protein
VTDNTADDQNQDSNGCGPLFLSYLHSQLGYSWAQIVAAGGSSLGATYQTLTGNDPASGFNEFVATLATLDTGGGLNLPASGNPFPIGAAQQPSQPPAQPGGQPQAPQPSSPPQTPPTGQPSAPPAPPAPTTSSGGGAGLVVGILVVLAIIVVVVIVLLTHR